MSNESVESRLAKLERLVDEQQAKLNRIEDTEAIRRLQYAYNYYVEHMLGQDVIDCFADDPKTKLNWLEGQYCGKEGVQRYFEKAARDENPTGMHQLMPTAGLITLNEDGKTALGRWFVFGGVYTPVDTGKVESGSLVSGVYEITYIKENGIWKILQIDWFIPYTVRALEIGLPEAIGEMIVRSADKPASEQDETDFVFPVADIPIDKNDLRYVSGYILPMHFPHPVTGEASTEARHNARLSPLKFD